MIANESLRYEMTSAPKSVYEINSYLNTGQLDLWGGGNLGSSEGDKLGSGSFKEVKEWSFFLLSKLKGLNFVLWGRHS